MYTRITSSVTFGNEIKAGLLFDKRSLAILVKTSIDHINRSIEEYKRSKARAKKDPKKSEISKYDLTEKIGVSWEIIELSILVGTNEKELRFSKDLVLEIKKLAIKLDKFIHKLGEWDSDFVTMDETQRARPSNEFLEYIKKTK